MHFTDNSIKVFNCAVLFNKKHLLIKYKCDCKSKIVANDIVY